MKISEYLLQESIKRKWLANRIKRLKYTDIELDVLLPCPSCKQEAKLEINTQNDGYCNYLTANVSCTNCRIQTRYRCIDGHYGDTSTINDVINDWNSRA